MDVPRLNVFSKEEAEEASLEEEIFSKIAHALIAHSRDDGDIASHDVSSSLAKVNKRLLKAKIELDKVTKIGAGARTNKEIGVAIDSSLEEIRNTMVSLQFFDRIAQRMEHAMAFLDILHSQQGNTRLANEAEVRRALVRLYNVLTMEDERDIFRSIERGESLKRALKNGHKKLKNMLGEDPDKVQFF